jgi:hypothetical protein
MLTGAAVTFAVVATLAAVAGGWPSRQTSTVALPQPRFAAFWTRAPASGARRSARQAFCGFWGALVRSGCVATGFLWAPCAGRLILTGAALEGARRPAV